MLALALGSVVGAQVASAHSLSISTARVALRDRHLEVQAEWDAFGLVAATPTDGDALDELAVVEPD